MTSLTIKLVRHGESHANTGAVHAHEVGDHGIELTERGAAQARAVGATIGPAFFTEQALLSSSPYVRARQTMSG